jgi:hypothetical protein
LIDPTIGCLNRTVEVVQVVPSKIATNECENQRRFFQVKRMKTKKQMERKQADK